MIDLLALCAFNAAYAETIDSDALERAKETGLPVALILNKIDLVKDKADLLPFVESISKRHAYQGIHYLQATRGMEYNPLTRRYWLSGDTSVNYLLATRRGA